MSLLRIVLILLGIAFLVGVYLYTRRHPPRRDNADGQRVEPTLTEPPRPPSTEAGTSTTEPEPAPVLEQMPERQEVSSGSPAASRAPGDVHSRPRGSIFSLALRLPGDGVSAQSVLRTLERLEFTPGDNHVYHRLGGEGEPLFTAANLFEPGVLHPLPDDAVLRGLVFFFQATPGAEASGRFDRMLGAARECAERFGGRVEDGSHRPLTAARELELKLAAAGARDPR